MVIRYFSQFVTLLYWLAAGGWLRISGGQVMEGRTTVTGARHIINVNVVLGSWTPDKGPSSYLFLYSVDSSSFRG